MTQITWKGKSYALGLMTDDNLICALRQSWSYYLSDPNHPDVYPKALYPRDNFPNPSSMLIMLTQKDGRVKIGRMLQEMNIRAKAGGPCQTIFFEIIRDACQTCLELDITLTID